MAKETFQRVRRYSDCFSITVRDVIPERFIANANLAKTCSKIVRGNKFCKLGVIINCTLRTLHLQCRFIGIYKDLIELGVIIIFLLITNFYFNNNPFYFNSKY